LTRQNIKNGCSYGRETRAILLSFKEMVEKLISNETKHIYEQLEVANDKIDRLARCIDEYKRFSRRIFFSLLITVIGALVSALVMIKW